MAKMDDWNDMIKKRFCRLLLKSNLGMGRQKVAALQIKNELKDFHKKQIQNT
jgi:hypothetical protein